MKFLSTSKDGGPLSKVFGYWLVELKALFTIAVLRFDEGSREAFHSHAFDCWSWVLSGQLEEHLEDGTVNVYKASWRPVRTLRTTVHKVYGRAPRTWVLTFRGPWAQTWQEVQEDGTLVTLTHGRVKA